MNQTNKEIKKWDVHYEEDTDTLYVCEKPVPRDAELYMINNGYACYATKKGKIVGLMIEYFMFEAKNMVKKLKPLTKLKSYENKS